jgi:hemolysin-activating ACP:hemolysin acyltransferase
MTEDIVGLFKQFEKYEHKSKKQLENYLKPSIELNQYVTFYDENKIVGFVNWAYLHNLVQERFK